MATRDELLRRADVPDEDVDDLIEIAARRQDEARRAVEGLTTVSEVQKVAAELDIAPEHVESAIRELKGTREAEAQAAVRAQEERQRRRGRLGVVAMGAVGLAVCLGLGVGLLGWVGASGVQQAQGEAVAAEARVVAALERQASLAPQLAGLAGAGGADLAPLQEAVREAEDLKARLAAADALSAAIADRLGKLPPASTEAEQTLRVQLTD